MKEREVVQAFAQEGSARVDIEPLALTRFHKCGSSSTHGCHSSRALYVLGLRECHPISSAQTFVAVGSLDIAATHASFL